MNTNVAEIFGEKVFDDRKMRERLPKDTYRELKKTIDQGLPLNRKIANAVAHAMKVWAIEEGATHFTHWFQPMTGITAEKHDSFITPDGDGTVIMGFKGSELIKGEPDASSFPNGGLRATFEARGYTAWDPTSNAFIKEGVLCIPTAFCSYTGHALDKKTPLLRSMEAIGKQTKRILRLFGLDDIDAVKTTVGSEQEYFLVDRDLYNQRKDLIFTGRTLFGAPAPKGQEMEDHYFGTIQSRVKSFMDELNVELWKLGVMAKTQHNEVAPAQFEIAPIFSTTNLATDQNQLTMELIQRIAKKHNLVALLHEKPFEGINGSGKHNNWSLSTNTGLNLLEPGDTPYENLQFLTFLAGIVKAVDEHQDLLRLSVATAGNDHRLGANEAPPAIISIFTGDELAEVIEAIKADADYGSKDKQFMNIGARVLPKLPVDTTDRNRTSPFAFTGNKFEFRMPGSAQSIAGINMILNTAIADSLMQIADVLEQAEDLPSALHKLLRDIFTNHSRIIFNGNGYSDEWVEEAERRGLLNLKTAPEAIPYLKRPENIALFERHHVLSEEEVLSRYEILMEEYVHLLNIEARTMIDMASQEILPAVSGYQKSLADTVLAKTQLGLPADQGYEGTMLARGNAELTSAFAALEQLKADRDTMDQLEPIEAAADYVREVILPDMEELRKHCDALETMTDQKSWPFPGYDRLLFGL
ncbi:glutamine synthetase III [Allobaculum mucilyticum]|uniref:glutamine synthetase III family protein n=1 Tax=Allobaculum mucilyticum TaxID=2834459 RepID=UPI001E4C80C0|nr:glutamine synthetase III [Allobaculum mucilyticum]UNT96202.1 glutamine synthetase III [Allobaculum mucilyticum]